ncbi:MAG: TonB-dependent receptor [Acidobacteria bacterium]|nr:TonB-dependent receptor [Acidobacteriota bacterium]
MNKGLLILTLGLLSLFFSVQVAKAQVTTATISGTVRDETGAVLPAVNVTIKNLNTGIARTMVTDDRGRYNAPNLLLGNYEVQAELSGFQTAVRSGITLTVGQEAIVDFTTKVGSVTEKIVVTGEAPIVETTTATVAGLVESRQIQDLPLNGRSFADLAVLQPGVTLSRSGSKGFMAGNVQKISIAGARNTSSSFLLDGTDIKDVWGSTPGSVTGVSLGVDTVREFKVLVNSYSAEYGGNGGGVITSITRSGTNELHGSAFEFLRNSALDARNFFDRDARNPTVRSQPPQFKRNQFGATVGGPIRTDKTFFFGSYEGLRERLTTTGFQNVPTALAREGILPAGRVEINQAVVPYLNLIPLPIPNSDNRDGTGEFSAQVNTPADENYFMVRIDHNISENDFFFGRYTFDNGTKNNPEILGIRSVNDRSRNQYLTLEETRIFSPALLNVFRFAYNRSLGENDCVVRVSLPSSLELVPGRPFVCGGGLILPSGIVGLGASGSIPRLNAYNLYQGADNLTINKGTHSIKTGFQIKNIRANTAAWQSQAGMYTFTNLANFLTGRANNFIAAFPDASPVRSWRQTVYGFYLQDEFRWRPTVTLNFGLREEFVTGPVEVHGRAARFVHPLDGNSTIFGTQALYPTDKDLLEPRIGLSWDVFGNGKTSLRGGFGTFHDLLLPWLYATVGGARVPPFFERAQIASPPFPNAYALLDRRLSLKQIEDINPDRTPTTLQYNFTLQREILPNLMLMAGYIGSRGSHLVSAVDWNKAIPVTLSGGRKFFPEGSTNRNPLITEHATSLTNASSSYNAMIISVNKRFSKGFQFQGNYTFSKAIDETSQQFAPEVQSVSRQAMDPDDLHRDKSLSAYDVRHNFLFNYSWDLPFGSGLSGLPGAIVGGWQLNGIISLAAGHPVNVEEGFVRSRSSSTIGIAGAHERPDLVPGKSNNPVLGNPDQWMDAASFKLQDAGFYGNLGRNTVIGPGLANVDLSLFKNINVAGEKTLQFRAEFFNLFNHANFSSPSRVVFTDTSGRPRGDFGRIRSTVTTSRQVQFALKLLF